MWWSLSDIVVEEFCPLVHNDFGISTRLRSGLWLDHFKTLILFFFTHSVVDLLLCLGSLSFSFQSPILSVHEASHQNQNQEWRPSASTKWGFMSEKCFLTIFHPKMSDVCEKCKNSHRYKKTTLFSLRTRLVASGHDHNKNTQPSITDYNFMLCVCVIKWCEGRAHTHIYKSWRQYVSVDSSWFTECVRSISVRTATCTQLDLAPPQGVCLLKMQHTHTVKNTVTHTL